MSAVKVAPAAQQDNIELAVDPDLIRATVRGFFYDAKAGDGFIASRHFPQHPKKLPKDDKRKYSDPDWIEYEPGDIGGVVTRLITHAQDAARWRGESARVYSPPLVLFRKPDDGSKLRATEEAVSYCSTLSVDLDENPDASLARLREVLGDPWMVVESGGITAAGEMKKHVHWRLSRSARTADELFTVRQLRALAVDLVGADGSGEALCHPYRWPGSVHRKGDPRPCRIVEHNEGSTIVPHEVSDRLLEACLADGKDATTLRARNRQGKGDREFKTKRAWPREALLAFARAMPNLDGLVPWDDYRQMQMTLWDASHSSEDGLEALMLWSAKSGKHDADEVQDSWDHIKDYPPVDLSAGTLMWLLRRYASDALPAVRQWLVEDVAAGSEPELVASPALTPRVIEGGIFDGFEVASSVLPNAPVAPAAMLVTPLRDVPLFVSEMNARHAIIMHQGRTFTITVEADGSVHETRKDDLILRYADREVTIGEGKQQRVMSRYDAWIRSPDRARFENGWAFDPNGTPEGVFNRWRGFPPLNGDDHVDASGRGCELILAHMRDVVCAGNGEHFAYLIRWLAHLIQKPGEKPGVAVILKGLEGTGKDTLGYYVQAMLQKFYANTSHEKHVTGSFNKHLATVLFLHVEELGWLGKTKDKAGALKSIITNPNFSEEGKGKDVDMSQRSFLRVLVTSNEEHIVPASAEARRYFVLEVSDRRRKDEAYFKAIEAERLGVGPAALRKFLAAVDLTGFSVRNCPETDALADLKSESLEGFDVFWREIIEDEDAFHDENGESWATAEVLVPKDRFCEAYESWCRARKQSPESRGTVTKKLAKFYGVSAKTVAPHLRRDGRQVHFYRLKAIGEASQLAATGQEL